MVTNHVLKTIDLVFPRSPGYPLEESGAPDSVIYSFKKRR